MKKEYSLKITINEHGEVNATETVTGMGIHEVIGLLEMQKQQQLSKLQTTSMSMPGIIKTEE